MARKLRAVSGKTEVAVVAATNRRGTNHRRSPPSTALLVVFRQQHLFVLSHHCPEVDQTISMEPNWHVGTYSTIRVSARCVLRLRVTPAHPTPASSFISSAHRVPRRQRMWSWVLVCMGTGLVPAPDESGSGRHKPRRAGKGGSRWRWTDRNETGRLYTRVKWYSTEALGNKH